MTMTGSPTAYAFRALSIAIACGGCASHSQYVAPGVNTPPAFKENGNWKPAEPGDAIARGRWWEVCGDPSLNALEERIAVSNETLKAAEARFQAARAAVRGTRAGLFPQVTASPSIARAQLSANRAVSSFRGPYGDVLAPVDVSYEADVWGRIRSTIDVNRRTAQATAADLEAAALGLHAELAIDYFMLRGLDAEKALLDSTVTAYARALELTQNRFRGGLASQADVAQAETQLETTRGEAFDLGAARATLDHAIATLVGRRPRSVECCHSPSPRRAGRRALRPARAASAMPRPSGASPPPTHKRGRDRCALPVPTLSASGLRGEARSAAGWPRPATLVDRARPARYRVRRRRRDSDQARGSTRIWATYRETVLSAFQKSKTSSRRSESSKRRPRFRRTRSPPPNFPDLARTAIAAGGHLSRGHYRAERRARQSANRQRAHTDGCHGAAHQGIGWGGTRRCRATRRAPISAGLWADTAATPLRRRHDAGHARPAVAIGGVDVHQRCRRASLRRASRAPRVAASPTTRSTLRSRYARSA